MLGQPLPDKAGSIGLGGRGGVESTKFWRRCTKDTVNLEKIALVYFLRFLAFSLGRKTKIRNE